MDGRGWFICRRAETRWPVGSLLRPQPRGDDRMSMATGTTERDTAGRRPAWRWLPWTDGAGRFSALKLAVFSALLVPAALLLTDAVAGSLGPRPWNLAIHRVGWWTVVFLMASLTVTPLRRTPALERPDLGPPDGRRRRLPGDRPAPRAVCRRAGLGPRQGVERDRPAFLPDDRIRGAARPRGPGRHLDRRHGAPARRPALAGPAPAGLPGNGPRPGALLHADQGRRDRADPVQRAVSSG